MRSIPSLSSLACLAGVVTIGSVAGADVVYFQQGLDNAYVTSYSGTSDTSLNSASNGSNPGYNNGNMGGADFVMSNQTRTWEEMRTLFRFDLSVLSGQGLSVNGATLILRPVTGGSPDNVNVSLYAISAANADWQQGTSPSIVYNASPGSATWNEKVYQTAPWAGSPGLSTPDVDYDPAAVATGVYKPDDSSPLEFSLAPSLVQSWINAPAGNAGLLLLTDNDSTNGYNRFAEFFSSEATNSSLRPTLALDLGPAPEPAWLADASGDWNRAANWAGATVPNAPGATAVLGDVITAPRTVYTDTAVTVGTLRFDSPQMYVIAGAGSLTVQASSGAGLVSVLRGSPKINLPSFFASDTSIDVAADATLTLGNPVTIRAGKTVTKNGSISIEAPLILESGASLVNSAGAMSLFGIPSIAGGARIDLGNTSMIVDYRGLGSVASALRGQLASGAIMSSSAIPNQTGLGWRDDAASLSILVKYTYLGDTNLDGQVDVIDLGNLATAWQANGDWINGDSNYDGTVDVIDLGLLATNWQAGVGRPLGPESLGEALAAYGLPSVAVPEPAGTFSVLLCGLAVPAACRRLRRR